MKKQVNPDDTVRAEAYRLWMSSPMPMVTLTKTVDVTGLVKYGRKHEMKFNMLLCWCIGNAASGLKEFFLLPEKDGLYQYDTLSVNVIVQNIKGGINSCDIPVTDSLDEFNREYLRLTSVASSTCESTFLKDTMVVGTSAIIRTELDSITNQYTDMFTNPMVMWGRYRRKWFRYLLPISFQFHHVQMDGMQGAQFLAELQRQINDNTL
uniref:Chloramphenicol acetyltransferase n=1 Tax=uncultured bacterium pUR16A2 TaxID=1204710 RepID=R9R0A6_9BACT|nr:hypothetical protein [uncultured bacterium pUR16A2]